MKKGFVGLCSFMLFWGFSVNAQESFTIKGKISGLPENSRVSLSTMDQEADTLAFALIKSGEFNLQGKLQEAGLYTLNLDGVAKKTALFIGNESVSLTGDAENVQEIKVSGSVYHADFMQFQQTFDPLFSAINQFNQQFQTYQNTPPPDSLLQKFDAHMNTVQVVIDSFIEQTKAKPISAFLLLVTSELNEDFSLLQQRYQELDEPVQESFFGLLVGEMIEERTVGAIGSTALDFTQDDTAGNPVSLSSYKGKYVLVDFWASWCVPCRDENPNVVAAYEQFKDKNFTVLGVSLDRSREAWLQAIEEDALTWTQVSDLGFWNNEVAKLYRIRSIPTNILVDPNGKIIDKNLRGPALTQKLCALLGGCN